MPSVHQATLSLMRSGLVLPRNPSPHAAVDENYWAHYMISSDEGFVDTGVWMGLIRVFEHDYIWSYQLSKWLYGLEELVDENGGWLYAPKF